MTITVSGNYYYAMTITLNKNNIRVIKSLDIYGEVTCAEG